MGACKTSLQIRWFHIPCILMVRGSLVRIQPRLSSEELPVHLFMRVSKKMGLVKGYM